MVSRTERLFELLDQLRTRRTPVTAEQLATELGVSPRSVYRDIETLRALGATIDGVAGVGFRLRQGFLLPPLMLTPEEVDALTLGASWVAQRADPSLAAAAETSLVKIAAVLPDASHALNVVPTLVTAAPITAPTDPALIASLRDAIRRQHEIFVRYNDSNGRISERIIWPIAIAYFDQARILAAWCEEREAFRHFRTGRLQDVTLLGTRYPQHRDQLFRRWREQDPMRGLRS